MSYADGLNAATSDTAANSALSGNSRFTIRGQNIGTDQSRDFIKDRVTDDAYNIDRIDIDRGPNSVLFGITDPAGDVNVVGTRAVMKNTYSFASSANNWGGWRESFRLNQMLVKNKVAIFVAGLAEDHRTDQYPSDQKHYRLTASITVDVTPTTQVRATFEHGNMYDLIPRPWPAADGLSAWQAAGSQEIPAALQNGGSSWPRSAR